MLHGENTDVKYRLIFHNWKDGEWVCVGVWGCFSLGFVTSEVPAFSVLRLSFLFQKMLGQKR